MCLFRMRDTGPSRSELKIATLKDLNVAHGVFTRKKAHISLERGTVQVLQQRRKRIFQILDGNQCRTARTQLGATRSSLMTRRNPNNWCLSSWYLEDVSIHKRKKDAEADVRCRGESVEGFQPSTLTQNSKKRRLHNNYDAKAGKLNRVKNSSHNHRALYTSQTSRYFLS